MRKTFIAIGLLVAALATAGQLKNPSNPLTFTGKKLSTVQRDWPFPICPPMCDQDSNGKVASQFHQDR
jgi:hypothetical protein